jgi:hypothetical protein
VFPGGLLKCAVTLELLARMPAQKEVLATAQTHEAQEGAGGHRRLEKVHVRGCAQHHEPERNKRVRHPLTQRRKTDETAAFQRACFAMSSACMPSHRRVDDSEHEESAKIVAGEFCEVEKHPLPAGGAAAAKRGRELAIAGDWQSSRLLRVRGEWNMLPLSNNHANCSLSVLLITGQILAAPLSHAITASFLSTLIHFYSFVVRWLFLELPSVTLSHS